ncbi:MAG TPA: hypothetical protein VHL34_15560 [Rhizomicrobium sp.]|nr:hypothetical protein [Rhizomicrobium sp.]
MRRVVLFVLLALCVGAQAAHAQTCSQPDVQEAAAALHGAHATLQTFRVGDMEPAVPPPAQVAIVAMKKQLAALTVAYMRCAPEAADVRTIGRDLARLMQVRSVDNPVRFADEISVTVTIPRASLISVQSSFSVPCANDDVSEIFAFENGAWHEVLRLQSDTYKQIDGATGGLEVQVSPPDASGLWFAVTKSVAPWCSSTWSAIRYTIVRPSGDPLKPKRLLSREDSIWWGDEDFGRVRVGVRDVELRFHAEDIDAAVLNREWVRHFSVIGDQVARIPPYANTPRDFANEWIQSDWREASLWTPRKDLQSVHDKLHKQTFFDYASVRACRGGDAQIEIVYTNSYKNDDGPHTFLRVRQAAQMEAVSGKANADCRGPDTLKF